MVLEVEGLKTKMLILLEMKFFLMNKFAIEERGFFQDIKRFLTPYLADLQSDTLAKKNNSKYSDREMVKTEN